jgi:hypothetical protein
MSLDRGLTEGSKENNGKENLNRRPQRKRRFWEKKMAVAKVHFGGDLAAAGDRSEPDRRQRRKLEQKAAKETKILGKENGCGEGSFRVTI